MGRRIIAISGTAASGKGQLVERLIEENELNLKCAIYTTSRKPREGEIDGVNYHFISPDEFKKRINEGRFVEYEEVVKDKFYGTEISAFESAGSNFILEISPEKVNLIKQRLGTAVLTVFIGIGSFEKLRERFYIRNTETYDAIEARIRRVKEDMSYAKYFDLAVNNPLDGSEKYIAGILDTAHDFLFADNSVMLDEEDEGINVIGKTILRITELSKINTEGEYLFRGVSAFYKCEDVRERFGKGITPHTHTIPLRFLQDI